jgi:GT2 family glycosyltransferase
MTHKVYLLLPVHNRKEITRGFIECLAAQTFSNYHLVLIDDGSTDGTAVMVKEYIPSATVLRGNGNWWWAGSLQQGLNWLKKNPPLPSDVILMTNDDAELPPNFIERGCALLKPGVLMQAAICDDANREVLDIGVVYEDCKMLFRAPRPGEPVNCLTTNGLFIRWHDLQVVGGFYPRLLPHYLSDYEFTIRAQKKGLKLLVPPDLKLYWNRETTGFREIEEDSLPLFLSKFFSKKAASNPVYWTTFVFLVSPLKYLPLHLAKIWKSALFTIIKQMLRMLFPKQKQI